jgi:hypothetical protein
LLLLPKKALDAKRVAEGPAGLGGPMGEAADRSRFDPEKTRRLPKTLH